MSAEWTRVELEIPNDTCMYTMELPFEKRCAFVHTNVCSFDNIHILKPYSWIFCAQNEVLSGFGIFAMFLTLVLLFLIISIVADAFVCPCVAVIAKSLQLSDNIAGVTLLAFGNGSPDLFASFAGASLDHPEILFAGMTGSAMFVTSLIAGIIIYSRPFRVDAWPLVMNISFLIISYSILFGGFYWKNFDLMHCIAILGVYVLFMAVTVAVEMVEFKHSQFFGEKGRGSIPPTDRKQRASVAIEVLKDMGRRHSRPSIEEGEGYHWKKWKPLFRELVESMSTITTEDWKSSKTKDKIFLTIQGVNQFWLKIFLPVVNPELPQDGWCKLLVMINMLFFPIFILFSLNYIEHKIQNIPIWSIAIGLGLAGSIIVFFTTRSYAKPKHHTIFAVLGFVGSILMIRVIAQEIIIHLETIGARFTLTQPFLALTCLAFGNSVGDLVINWGLAKQGMQNMGLAACFGGPMFNSSLGVGLISLTIFLESGHNLDEYYGALSPVGSLYLFTSICLSFLILILLDFEARPSYGVFLITLYIIYLILTLLMEKEIHPFGTQFFRHKKGDD